MAFLIKLLDNKHLKKDFNCGYPLLDNYLQRQAKQDLKRDLSACYVLAEQTTNLVIGYYTLSASSIKASIFPPELTQKLPANYASLPTVLLGRLAVDISFKGQGFGEILLLDALKRCLDISETLGTLAVIVDPIDSSAENFYLRYGLKKLPTTGKMFITMKTVGQLFQ